MKPTPRSLWGIYLVDVFDNMTLIAEVEGSALFEPILLQPRKRPPVIPDRVRPEQDDRHGRHRRHLCRAGLEGRARAARSKSLRVFSYHFGYFGKASFEFIGTQAGWDVKRILGTTPRGTRRLGPVRRAGQHADLHPAARQRRPRGATDAELVGRACPANWSRAWAATRAGAQTLPPKPTLAVLRAPEPLTPGTVPPRPFDFAHEVYPVLQRHCIDCHNERPTVGPRSKPSFSQPGIAYDTLHPYVHRPGPESDMALLNPDGIPRVQQPPDPDARERAPRRASRPPAPESRERLYCWIDLNVPRRGSFDLPETLQHDRPAPVRVEQGPRGNRGRPGGGGAATGPRP